MPVIASTAADRPDTGAPTEGPAGGPRGACALAVVAGGPVALEVISALAPFSAVRRWPDRLPRGPLRRVGWWATVAGLATPLAYGMVLRPWLNRWGSTSEERRHRYPGDGDKHPLVTATRAVTIHAPAHDVWRWLVQIGQNRGGFYSYGWLERLSGSRLQGAEEIREDLQDLAAGDELRMFPGIATHVAEIDPPRYLVIENWGAYVVDPIDDHTCRLLARSHRDLSPRAIGYLLTMELPHAIMERRSLLGIKRRAEAAYGAAA